MTTVERRPWYLPDNVAPGQPRRPVAQEFFTNVLDLGRFARAKYLDECKAKMRDFSQVELDELDANIATIERELAKYQ